MQFNKDGNPTVSALYLVDRDKQGKYYRWFNAETDQWGMCGADMNEALDNKDKPSPVGFFPWVGPLTGKNFVPKSPVHVVDEDGKPAKKPAKKMARQRAVGTPKVTAAPKASGKVTHPDGTVFFRADRNKWVAMWAGKQEAARPTAEACLAFLQKKYNHTGTVLPKE
ncbi:MAG: hypothetical protein ACO29P_09260 [Bacteroidia bacterium]